MIKVHDTLTRQPREVQASADGVLRFYVCGPTVHDYAHVGNWRTYVSQDVFRRVLESRGFDVRLVINITDVEDKIIRRAQEAGIDVTDPARLPEYTRRYEEAYLEDAKHLRVLPAHEYPRATEHVPGMIELVGKLVDRGHAYESDGSVYFRIASLPEYGKLSRIDADEIRAGARVDNDEYDKGDVRDFVLWKAWKDGEPRWESPWGPGRPGWHLECSEMSMKCLEAETIDLHAGGEDLVFPHHENEIAQSEGATGKPFCDHWVHCAHLRVDGQKMAKSLGNFYTLRDLVEKGHDPVAIRYLLGSVHYRAPINLTDEAITGASKAVERLNEFGRLLAEAKPAGDGGEVLPAITQAVEEFDAALDDDLNTSGALGTLFSAVRDVNAAASKDGLNQPSLAAARQLLERADEVFAFLPESGVQVDSIVQEIDGKPYEVRGTDEVPTEILERVVERQRARTSRDFATADKIRDELTAGGWIVDDVPGGARVKRD